MKTRPLGSLQVPVVGLGCNNFGTRIDAAETAAVVHAALDAGVTFFDTADVYGQGRSEQYLGEALGSRRSEATVATKFGMQFGGDPPGKGASAQWIATAVEASLRRLGTDHIDLYQLHAPDRDVPIAETLGALDDLVRAGKVRAVGCSNFSADQIDEAAEIAAAGDLAAFVSVQNQYSLLHRTPEDGVLDACSRHRAGFLPFFPLHAGVLTGKYRRGAPLPDGSRLANMAAERVSRFYDDDVGTRVERLTGFCEERGRSLLELAFSWLLTREPVSSVIAGATSPHQVRSNAAAATWELSDGDLAAVDAILAESG